MFDRFMAGGEPTSRPSRSPISLLSRHAAYTRQRGVQPPRAVRGPKEAAVGPRWKTWRPFGTRWARLAPTAVLMQLMRHESIQTTNAYYVDLNADEIAEDLYRDFGRAGTVSGTVAPAVEDSSGGANDTTLC